MDKGGAATDLWLQSVQLFDSDVPPLLGDLRPSFSAFLALMGGEPYLEDAARLIPEKRRSPSACRRLRRNIRIAV